MEAKKSGHGQTAEVICIGTELLYNRVNTDVNIISELLFRQGLRLRRCTIVADVESDIQDALRETMERSDIIFLTGGLGPTSDDITKESVASLIGRKLEFSDDIWTAIIEKFRKRDIPDIPEVNKKQAYVIEGAEIIGNDVGTAPGEIVREGDKTIVILPGPPVELKPMAEYFISKLGKSRLQLYTFGFAGLPESVVEERVQKIFKRFRQSYTILAHPMFIEVFITGETIQPEMLSKVKEDFKEAFGINYLGEDPRPLPETLGNMLKKRGLRLALAESCTGGLAGKIITDLPGSSGFFMGSFVAYSNIVKKRALKVPKTVIKKYGAVSGETAIAMAKGARRQAKADVAISYTGVAGPSGGSQEKPAGTVYIGIALPGNASYAVKFFFPGNRQLIRERTAYQGFELMRQALIRMEQKSLNPTRDKKNGQKT